MEDIALKKVLWHSRRGMLELDLLLVPFATHRFPALSPSLQAAYQALLACEDQDIFAWLLHRQPPADPRLEEIISLILESGTASD